MNDPSIRSISRRRFLLRSAMAAGGASLLLRGAPRAAAVPIRPRKNPPEVAAIITEYRPWSHADVIAGRLIQGYLLDLEPRWSPVRVRSMYIDQFPPGDLSRAMSKQYGIPIAKTVREALLDADGELAADGVVLIGEHGDYPQNERGQHLYPRRRFFEEAAAAFRESGRVVPVFNDKHLAPLWNDAEFMYRTAKEMGIPFLAGSSLPLAWRRPPLEIPLGARVEEALAIGYGGIESYGFHGLETLQCMTERRAGGETGVRTVQCLEGESVWKAMREGRFSRELAAGALARHDPPIAGDFEERCPKPAAFLIEYRDGLRGTLLMLNGLASGFLFAARLAGCARPVSTLFRLQEPAFGHFSYLANAIAQMVLTGEPPYPVERTVITTGILAAAMDSRFERHRLVETPHLAISYRPVDHDLGAYRHPEAADTRHGGWIELFDGRSLDGWCVHGKEEENEKEDAVRWEIKDGVLRGSGGPGVLVSWEVFDDFELFAELRASAGEGGRGRSSIAFRAERADLSAEGLPGYEIRCGGPDGPPGSIRGAEIEDARPDASRTKDGEWFTLRLRASGDRFETRVNGVPAAAARVPESSRPTGPLILRLHDRSASLEVRELRARRI